MNTNSKRLGAYLSAMLIATAVAVSLRTVACIKQLNFANGFFLDRSLVNVSDAIIALCAIGMMSYVLVASRISLRANFSTSSTYVPTGILAVATVFLGVKTVSHALTTSKYPLFSAETLTLKNPTVVLGVLIVILSVLSAAHLFFNAFITESKTTLRAYFAIATIALLAFYSMLIYLDGTLSINDSNKVLRQMAFIFSALFFLYEARISLGREMWRAYTVFGLIAASLTAYASIPAIITYYVNGEIVSHMGYKSLASIEEYLLMLALFIYILARLLLTSSLIEKKDNELIKMLDSNARECNERVNESYERFQEAFAAKQLSIFDLYGSEEEIKPEEAEEIIEESVQEDVKQEPTISDDAIFESIFGRMPKRPVEQEDIEPTQEDDREPEAIAEDLFNTIDKLLSDATQDKEKETDI